MPTLESATAPEVTTTVEANGKAPKAPKAKKPATKKPATKKAPAKGKGKAPKGKAKKAPKAPKAPRVKKGGLRKAQVQHLKVLAKGGEVDSKKLAEKAGNKTGCLTYVIGSPNVELRKQNDKDHYPCLLTLGFVKASENAKKKPDGTFSEAVEHSYTITASGKKALESAEKVS